jgi:hypothetical protein
MWPAKRIPGALLAVAIAAYGPDCLGMATREQAIECCRAMHCHAHGRHSQDCCGTTLSVRAVVGQPSSLQGLLVTPVAMGVVEAVSSFQIRQIPVRMVSKHSHDPPPSNSIPALALRI